MKKTDAICKSAPKIYERWGTVDAGASLALDELSFLTTLLVELGGRVEEFTQRPMTLVLNDVLRDPASRADHYLSVEKPTQELLELIAALRARTSELVGKLIETAGHGVHPKPDGGA